MFGSIGDVELSALDVSPIDPSYLFFIMEVRTLTTMAGLVKEKKGDLENPASSYKIGFGFLSTLDLNKGRNFPVKGIQLFLETKKLTSIFFQRILKA